MSDPTQQYLRTFSRDLPVTLSDHELQVYGKMLADKVKEEDLAQEAKKAEMSRRSTAIKAITNEIKRIADARQKGEELRPVVCGERLNGNVIEVVRLDRHEVVDSRPAGMEDLQTTMPLGGDDTGEPLDEGGPLGEDGDTGGNGAMTTSSTGADVYVGDVPPDEETGAGAAADGDGAVQWTEGAGEGDGRDDGNGDVPPEGEEGDWLDKKLAERDAANQGDADSKAKAKPERSRSAKVNAAKNASKKPTTGAKKKK